jgi:hypothetical protein
MKPVEIAFAFLCLLGVLASVAVCAHLGKDISMMTDRTGNEKKKPLTMKTLRLRIESGAQVDMFDIGGCGCFA